MDTNKAAAIANFERLKNEIATNLDNYIIPMSVLDGVVENAIRTLCKFPKMKPSRIARKVADKFKLKLKPVTADA
jgi:hypothetical protein